MKFKYKEYLTFNKSERNGLIVLSIILLIVVLLPSIYEKFINKENTINIKEFQAEINSFIKDQKIIAKETKNKFQYKNKTFNYNNISKSVAENQLTPFFFNPNNLPYEKWQKLGLRDEQIKVIKNFEEKGGKFYKKEDLKKIYSISESDYQVLEPYILIPDSKVFNQTTDKPIKKQQIIDINHSDTSELKLLNGIGSKLSKRILKYRESLGGFHSKEQLKEVFGISPELYQSIEPNVIISQSAINKININSASIETLNKHPYIDYYVAKSIVKYREMHGNYSKIEDIKKSELVHEDLFNKIKPYITIN